jgi:hypothetical protein
MTWQERKTGDFTMTFRIPEEYNRRWDSVTLARTRTPTRALTLTLTRIPEECNRRWDSVTLTRTPTPTPTPTRALTLTLTLIPEEYNRRWDSVRRRAAAHLRRRPRRSGRRCPQRPTPPPPPPHSRHSHHCRHSQHRSEMPCPFVGARPLRGWRARRRRSRTACSAYDTSRTTTKRTSDVIVIR